MYQLAGDARLRSIRRRHALLAVRYWATWAVGTIVLMFLLGAAVLGLAEGG
jgi:hypothetical protein